MGVVGKVVSSFLSRLASSRGCCVGLGLGLAFVFWRLVEVSRVEVPSFGLRSGWDSICSLSAWVSGRLWVPWMMFLDTGVFGIATNGGLNAERISDSAVIGDVGDGVVGLQGEALGNFDMDPDVFGEKFKIESGYNSGAMGSGTTLAQVNMETGEGGTRGFEDQSGPLTAQAHEKAHEDVTETMAHQEASADAKGQLSEQSKAEIAKVGNGAQIQADSAREDDAGNREAKGRIAHARGMQARNI